MLTRLKTIQSVECKGLRRVTALMILIRVLSILEHSLSTMLDGGNSANL